uniref:Uncharacterized protein n=1 Tax=Zooxanthella nutricula TaxID=1333877 RepID=A0A7S2IN10_9DINO
MLKSSSAPIADVFAAAAAWAEAAEQRNEDIAGAWRQIAKSGVVPFHLVDPRAFAERVVVPGLISNEQALSVFVTIALGNGPARPRNMLDEIRTIVNKGRLTSLEDAGSCAEALFNVREKSNGWDFEFCAKQALLEKALRGVEHVGFVGTVQKLFAGKGRGKIPIREDLKNLVRTKPSLERFVGVWHCPVETLEFARAVAASCNHIHFDRAVEFSKECLHCAEDGQYLQCEPIAAAEVLVRHLQKRAASLPCLPGLLARLAAAKASADAAG